MNISEIESEIKSLEQGETNWTNIQRLAWLYTVYDHMTRGGDTVVSYNAVRVMPDYGGEFGEAVSGKSIDNVMQVLTEHMAVIKVLHAKEYQAVLDRIKEGS